MNHYPSLGSGFGRIRRRAWLLSQATVALILLTAGLLLLGASHQQHPDRNSSLEPTTVSSGRSTASRRTKPIEEIQVGDRVTGENPLGDWDNTFGPVEASTWRRVELRAPKRDGEWADVTLLRPLWWLEARGATLGGTIQISVPECGIDGNAEVLAIGPCPEPNEESGQIVTGTFRHSAASIYDIQIRGTKEVISSTGNHPFWSEDRYNFVRADTLTAGDRLRSLAGPFHVAKIERRAQPVPVFNLEVHGTHVYHVGHAAVLVHNGGACAPVLQNIWDSAKKLAPELVRYEQDYAARTLASAPDGRLFISGKGEFQSKTLEAFSTVTQGRFVPNMQQQHQRVKEIIAYFNAKNSGKQYFPAYGGDFIVDGQEAVGSHFASHAEVQAAYETIVRNKSTLDNPGITNEFTQVVISISHTKGPCSQSCQRALEDLARWEGVPIRIEWYNENNKLFGSRTFGDNSLGPIWHRAQ